MEIAKGVLYIVAHKILNDLLLSSLNLPKYYLWSTYKIWLTIYDVRKIAHLWPTNEAKIKIALWLLINVSIT
jgi:hypothetical protein